MSYEVSFARAAARQFRKLPAETQEQVRESLKRTASRPIGGRGGKSLKLVRGRSDRFFRLRIGDHRAMFDVIEDEKTVLVLGIIHRRDLERWLRTH